MLKPKGRKSARSSRKTRTRYYYFNYEDRLASYVWPCVILFQDVLFQQRCPVAWFCVGCFRFSEGHGQLSKPNFTLAQKVACAVLLTKMDVDGYNLTKVWYGTGPKVRSRAQTNQYLIWIPSPKKVFCVSKWVVSWGLTGGVTNSDGLKIVAGEKKVWNILLSMLPQWP